MASKFQSKNLIKVYEMNGVRTACMGLDLYLEISESTFDKNIVALTFNDTTIKVSADAVIAAIHNALNTH